MAARTVLLLLLLLGACAVHAEQAEPSYIRSVAGDIVVETPEKVVISSADLTLKAAEQGGADVSLRALNTQVQQQQQTILTMQQAIDELKQFVAALTGSPCTAGKVAKAVAADGQITCTQEEVQVRVTGTCPDGESIRTVAADGTVTCEKDDDTVPTASMWQRRLDSECPEGSSIRGVDIDGKVTCEIDDDTPILASEWQKRLKTECLEGESMQAVAEDGSVTCKPSSAASESLLNNLAGCANKGTLYSSDLKQCVPAAGTSIVTCDQATATGIYSLVPPGRDPLQAYCDVRGNKKYLVMQRRIDATIDFSYPAANYNTYANGFGEPEGNVWIGNDNLAAWTGDVPFKLRVELEDFDGNSAFAEYEWFKVWPASDGYQLEVYGYNPASTAGDSLLGHSGYKFSTQDKDQDVSTSNCAASYKGGWWYSACHSANLNGLFHGGEHQSYADGINWYAWKGHYYSLKSWMMIAPHPVVDSCQDAETEGFYKLLSFGGITTFCQEDSGSMWAVIQRRVSDAVSFERQWADYARGFGYLAKDGNGWIGNDNLAKMTASGPRKLKVLLNDLENNKLGFASYGKFSIADASGGYKLTVSDFQSTATDASGRENAGDSLLGHSGAEWSTTDKGPSAHCAVAYKGAWWYTNCHSSNLNGKFYGGVHETYADGIEWYSWTGHYNSLASVMMIS